MSPVATSRSFSNPKKAAKRATSYCSETGRIAPVAWRAAIWMLSTQCPSHRSLAKAVKSQHPDVRVIMLSAAFESSQTTLAKRIGINAILSKPVEPETLLEIVRAFWVEDRQITSSPQTTVVWKDFILTAPSSAATLLPCARCRTFGQARRCAKHGNASCRRKGQALGTRSNKPFAFSAGRSTMTEEIR